MTPRAYSHLGIPDLPEEAFQPRHRGMALYKKGSGSAPAPDPAVGQAALEEMALGRDWLSFAKDQFNQGNIRQDALDALTQQVTQQQIAAQNENMANAREDRNRYKSVFQPLQDQFIKEAQAYNTPEKQNEMAAEAQADVSRAAAAQAGTNARQMASMGLNPNSGRWAGVTAAQDTTNALAGAAAQNNARQSVRDRGTAMLADAINIGSGLPSQTAASYGTGLNAGNSSVSNNLGVNGNWRANVGIMGQGYSGAISGLSSGASALNNQYSTQGSLWAQQQQANGASAGGIMSGIGSIAGMGIMAF